MCRLLAEPVCVCLVGDTLYILQRVVCRQNNICLFFWGGGGGEGEGEGGREGEREREREREREERERERVNHLIPPYLQVFPLTTCSESVLDLWSVVSWLTPPFSTFQWCPPLKPPYPVCGQGVVPWSALEPQHSLNKFPCLPKLVPPPPGLVVVKGEIFFF